MAPFWKNEELEDAKAQSHILLDTSAVHDKIPSIFPKESLQTEAFKLSPVHVTDSLWVDSGLQEWSQSQGYLKGSGHYLWNFIQQPTFDETVLTRRQNTILNFSKVATSTSTSDKALSLDKDLQILQGCEKDILWLLNLPPFADAWPLNLAFPAVPILKYINYYPLPLTIFHIYKIFVAPIMHVVSPISTIVGPWIYLRRNLKLQISFKAYTNVLFMALKQGFKPSFNIKQDSIKYFTLFLYIFFYIYSIIQCFEQARILFTILTNLREKLASIRQFIKTVQQLMKEYPQEILREFLPEGFEYPAPIKLLGRMSGMYVLFTQDKVKNTLKSLLQWSYALESAHIASGLLTSKKCCQTSFIHSDGSGGSGESSESVSETQFWNMGHVLLGNQQIKNPLSLNKNLIITGPNAAGKTTYVRAVCTNTILSQTFGIACALRAEVSIVHAIGSFMRIEDSLGQASLFEAEAKRCSELLIQSEAVSNSGLRGLYFLDEPMHSTPPIEGCATSMAVIEYMGKLPGIRLLVTTHYHDCIKLEEMHPEYFQNISMDAFLDKESELYKFPYRIKNGASIKCIALELLNEKKLPKSLITRAIILKNKICAQQVTNKTDV
jgi:hypothetical protein